MTRKRYGSVVNRLYENPNTTPEITVGTGMTEYLWSDRHAWEVIEVADQKHVTVREYDHRKKENSKGFDNDWELISNENNRTMNLVKRGKYWYAVAVCTVDDAKEILAGTDNLDERLWACHNGFDLEEIVNTGKAKKKYHKKNVSFGRADYYYDYEF